MTYRGYSAVVEFDEEALTFFGRVINSDALVSFRGDTPDELVQSFHDSVDSYLETCDEMGVAPEKTYNGTLSVRMDPAIHQAAAVRSAELHESLNQYITDLVRQDVHGHEVVEKETFVGGDAWVGEGAVAYGNRSGTRYRSKIRRAGRKTTAMRRGTRRGKTR
jgi:predicted HicB family RNase H-like nuclease